MKLGKNLIWIFGLAIFLGAMIVLSDLMLAVFSPIISMFGGFAIIAVLLMVFIGAWIMNKGRKV